MSNPYKSPFATVQLAASPLTDALQPGHPTTHRSSGPLNLPHHMPLATWLEILDSDMMANGKETVPQVSL